MSFDHYSYNFDQLLSQFGYTDNLMTQSNGFPLGENLYECSRCLSQSLCIDEGILLCQSCKSEYGGLIDDTAEWRNYGSDDHRNTDPNRCGASSHPLLIESSYGTTLGYSSNNYFRRLKQLNNWQAMPSHERSLKSVFDRLTQNGHNSGLTPNIIEFSHKLFVEATETQALIGETKLSRADPRDGLIAACLFYSCKEHGCARSSQEMAKMCEIDSKDMTRGINLFHKLMTNSKSINLAKYTTKYSDFIERYCYRLNITKYANEILIFAQKVDELRILTKNRPQAVACGCIFFIATMYRLGITKMEIHNQCGPSIPTISKSYEKLVEHTQELI